ncbi:DUF2997 domain-containing protein [Bremerella cremea]|uniref:DUF2997 domain-containing protein n=1 Tax=Blastopirellula marina TaxID=124 RepID=A0A2S8G7F5_9BACT|nr:MULTISPECIES: DUF2997 domain-containing protein [Pirellulaceae]PQO40369.1 hypothetical protein C5Y83_00050 [Blastopirellula marina]RCS51951.1 DUF2997 domain-containing protein [Bremerella cremea]
MSKTIEILVSPQGETRITTFGFSGAGCQEASRFLESALGQRSGERLTADFYQDLQQQERSQVDS